MVFEIVAGKQIKTGMRQLIFWIEPQLKAARQIEIFHQRGGPVEKTRLWFSPPELMAAEGTVPASASALVFDQAGKLLPAYKGYQLVYVDK